MESPDRPAWPDPDPPDEVNPSDAEKVYGALTHYHLDEKGPVAPDELNPPFRWGEYLTDCLEYLVDAYDGVREEDGEYWIEELEQEKHLERTHG